MTNAGAPPAEHRFDLGERSGFKVSIRLIELSDDEQARRLRDRQLEAIVGLPRRASARSARAP